MINKMGLAIINNFRTKKQAQEYINEKNHNWNYIILFEPNYDEEKPWTVNID